MLHESWIRFTWSCHLSDSSPTHRQMGTIHGDSSFVGFTFCFELHNSLNVLNVMFITSKPSVSNVQIVSRVLKIRLNEDSVIKPN